jgi:DNA-binding response OmpR family regulator
MSGPLCDHLNEAGFNALAVASGDEAARMLDRGIFAIDLVFSDAHVPGILNGYALAQWMSERTPGIPVLLALDDMNAIDVIEEPAQSMPKPYDCAAVVRGIKATLARHVKRRA